MKLEGKEWLNVGMELTILGQTPSKKNSRINTRSGRSFPSKRYTEWHKSASEQLETILKDEVTINSDSKCEINYMFYVQDLRRRDVSNMIESINDLFVDLKLVEDDDWKHVRIGFGDAELDRENPRAEISIIPYRR